MQSRITSAGLIVRRDAAEAFVYPDHIDRASIDALPSKPGIYIFWDENDKPLYIGKSVNIRSRVLSHLRTPEEARMPLFKRPVRPRWTPFFRTPTGRKTYREWIPFLNLADASYWNAELTEE